MKTIEDIKLEMKVSDLILEVARVAEQRDIDNSDLQGLAQVSAMKIIKLLREV